MCVCVDRFFDFTLFGAIQNNFAQFFPPYFIFIILSAYLDHGGSRLVFVTVQTGNLSSNVESNPWEKSVHEGALFTFWSLWMEWSNI